MLTRVARCEYIHNAIHVEVAIGGEYLFLTCTCNNNIKSTYLPSTCDTVVSTSNSKTINMENSGTWNNRPSIKFD